MKIIDVLNDPNRGVVLWLCSYSVDGERILLSSRCMTETEVDHEVKFLQDKLQRAGVKAKRMLRRQYEERRRRKWLV